MPYISVRTSVPVSDEMADQLQRSVVEVVSLIPGKSLNNCMVEFVPNCRMYLKDQRAKTVFCEIKLFGYADRALKEQIVKRMNDLFTEALGVDMVYTSIQENAEFGVGPGLKCV